VDTQARSKSKQMNNNNNNNNTNIYKAHNINIKSRIFGAGSHQMGDDVNKNRC